MAVGGPVAVRPTPLQAAAGFSRRVGEFPRRQVAQVVNRSVQTFRRASSRTAETVSAGAARSREALGEAGEVIRAGRDASLRRGEQLAAERGDSDRASDIHRTRRDLGALDAAELPIRNYDSLNAPTARDRIQRLADTDDVQAILAYEMANKARKAVVEAARQRHEDLAAELAAAS